MRTTLEIDDAVLAAARALARDGGISIGAAVSELALRGLSSVPAVDHHDGFPTFSPPSDARPITLELVNEFRD
jgi:hypothetical protein